MIYFYTEVQFSSSPRLDLVLSFPSVAAVLCLLSVLRENMDIYIHLCQCTSLPHSWTLVLFSMCLLFSGFLLYPSLSLYLYKICFQINKDYMNSFELHCCVFK